LLIDLFKIDIKSLNFDDNYRTPIKKVKTSEAANSSFNSYQKSVFKGVSADKKQLFMVFPLLPKEDSQNL